MFAFIKVIEIVAEIYLTSKQKRSQFVATFPSSLRPGLHRTQKQLDFKDYIQIVDITAEKMEGETCTCEIGKEGEGVYYCDENDAV